MESADFFRFFSGDPESKSAKFSTMFFACNVTDNIQRRKIVFSKLEFSHVVLDMKTKFLLSDIKHISLPVFVHIALLATMTHKS